ncbi:uncharacterized protein TNCV_4480221 [Trichonephila clavipes]|nr:uncharacterized protein TNCV_4480221 [Trichonephila clavipes]
MAPRLRRAKCVVHITARVADVGRKVHSGYLPFRTKMQVLNQSCQNDRLRVMLELVHIDIIPPKTFKLERREMLEANRICPRARHHCKWRRRLVRIKGSTRSGYRDPKCPSARRLRMVREDTGASSEGATCAWMAANEAVGCTRGFITMWWPSRRLVRRVRPEPGLSVNDIFRIH